MSPLCIQLLSTCPLMMRLVGGFVIYVCIIVVQGETMRPKVTIIRVEDNEVDYLEGMSQDF